MVAEIKINIDSCLRTSSAEIEAFEERIEYGEKILDAEWEINKFDWYFLMVGDIEALIKHKDELNSGQINQLRDLVKRLKILKAYILQKGYEYPDVIEKVDI